jgi:phosphatidylglycerol:prolipoprotein diacylglycerol transferase
MRSQPCRRISSWRSEPRAKSLTHSAALWQKPRVLATFLHSFGPFVFSIHGYGPRWYGLSYVLAALTGFWLYRHLARRRYTDIAPEKVADFITWCGLFGVLVGGRIGWIIFYGFKEPHENPWWMFEVWKGGMASHGGILGLVAVTFVLSRKWKVSWTSIGDTLCVVATTGLFVVRCANFINGELIGKPASASCPWAVQFPRELLDTPIGREDITPKVAEALQRPIVEIVETIPRDAETNRVLAEFLTPRHPSQLYEALLEGALMFTVLWLMRTRCRMPRGVLTGSFFILYATTRIVAETFREPDPAWAVGSFSAGQFLSLFMYGIGAAFIAWGLKTRHYEKADT